MAELEEVRAKLAKQDWKEANELLVAVGKQDEERVRRLLGVLGTILMPSRAPCDRVV